MNFANFTKALALFLTVAVTSPLSSCAKQSTKVEVTPADCKNLGFVAPPKQEVKPDRPIGRAFTATAQGRGLIRFGKVSVKKNKALIEIDGRKLPGLVYTTQNWEEYGYELLNVIITDNQAYTVVYLYCRDGKLTNVYWESYDEGLKFEDLTGSCALSHEVSKTKHAFHRVAAPTNLLEGYTIDGPNIHLDASGQGELELINNTYKVKAFALVGCSDCVTATRKGWEELHIWLGQQNVDCFGVLYLFNEASNHQKPMSGQAVQLGYGFCTHPVQDLPNTLFRATWSVGQTLVPETEQGGIEGSPSDSR